MYALAVGLTDALWLCPEHALRLFLASVSFVDPVRTVAPLAPSLCWRAVALAEGRLPIRRAPSEPMGLAVAPPISHSTGPGRSPHLAVRPLELRSVSHTFPARHSASIHGDNICQFY